MADETNNPKEAEGRAKAGGFHAIPPLALVMLARVMEYGAYDRERGAGNWNEKGAGARHSTYFDATMRHLLRIQTGVDMDKDTLVDEWAHVMANAAIMIDAGASGSLIDDRAPFHGIDQAMDDIATQKLIRQGLK